MNGSSRISENCWSLSGEQDNKREEQEQKEKEKEMRWNRDRKQVRANSVERKKESNKTQLNHT